MAVEPLRTDVGDGATVSWNVPVEGKLHKVNFFHSFTELCQMDLNGEDFVVGGGKAVTSRFFCKKNENPSKKCFIYGDLKLNVWVSCLGDDYVYALDVNNLSLKKYKEEYYKKFNVWKFEVDGKEWRVVLDKNTLNICGNGEKIDEGKTIFAENDGSSANFLLGTAKCSIEIEGNKSTGMTQTLLVNGEVVPLDIDLDEPLHRRLDKWSRMMSEHGRY